MGTIYLVKEEDIEKFCDTHWVVSATKMANGYKCIVRER